MPDSQQQRHTTPGQAQNTFTLTHCLCFQFSAFCWVALAARVCQGWVLGVLARQVPTVGKPTPLTILCKPAYKAGPVGANKTTNIVPGGVGDTNAPPPSKEPSNSQRHTRRKPTGDMAGGCVLEDRVPPWMILASISQREHLDSTGLCSE